MAIEKLWTEAYRPATIEGYVFQNPNHRQQVESWIEQKSIPHLLFSGHAGTGKTTLAKILTNELGVQDTDILFANASKEGRKIEWLNEKLTGFCQTMPFGDFKVVILDEADFLNPLSVQPALRNLMEEYSHSVRFILTCNYPSKIIPALHSRLQHIQIEKADLTEFTARAATILVEENIDFDLDTLDTFVKASYPDLRKCINNLQMHSFTGTLVIPDAVDSGSADYRVEMVELFKKGKIGEARKLICKQAQPEEMEELYKWLYSNISLFGDTEDKQDNAILIIKQALVDHTICADSEINLAACMIRLARNM